MKSIALQEFTDLIADALGLCLRDQVKNTLWQKILMRVKALGFSSPDLYYQFLASGRHSIPYHSEWRELINLLSVTESYFFRDKGQFSLLKKHIIPDLIQRKQTFPTSQNNLIRVWSAGCSTGEEVYSLAILIKELIPAGEDLSIMVVGTDINESSLEQARCGIYGDWSFRSVDPAVKAKYFRSHRKGWEIDPSIRELVSFYGDNLAQLGHVDTYLGTGSLDLILCRNVFIYFDATAIARVLNRFHQALLPNGYLMTGHTELQGQDHSQFEIKIFPESIIYQRKPEATLNATQSNHQSNHQQCFAASAMASSSSLMPSSLSASQRLSHGLSSNGVIPTEQIVTSDRSSTASLATTTTFNSAVLHPSNHAAVNSVGNQSNRGLISPLNLFDQLITFMERKAYPQAIQTAQHLIAQEPQHLGAYCLLAEAYANSGNYANAVQTCQQALGFNPFAIEPFYLLAHISEEQGDLEGAKLMLKQIIYLSPTSVYAYFELGCLYEQEGNEDKAQRTWRSALDVIKRVPTNLPMDSLRDHGKDINREPSIADVQVAIEQKLNTKVSA